MDNFSEQFEQFLRWESVSRDSIDVKTIYIDMAGGDHAAGIFLSQLIYWYIIPGKNGRSKLRVRRDGHRWVVKSRDEWYDEIRLRPRQFDRVAKLLSDAGLIEVKVMKFAGAPTTHTRLIVDNFMKLWNQFADGEEEEAEELPRDVRSISPDREIHIQRLLLEDKGSLVDNTEGELDDDDAANFCVKCGRTDELGIRDDVDTIGRCPWCFVLDGWSHYVGVRVPKRTGTSLSDKLRKKATARMRDQGFASNWIFALEKAGKMKHLTESAWFTLEFFLRNDENYQKILGDKTGHNGMYDSFEKQRHPDSYARMQAWLAARAAGVANVVPQAGWAVIQ